MAWKVVHGAVWGQAGRQRIPGGSCAALAHRTLRHSWGSSVLGGGVKEKYRGEGKVVVDGAELRGKAGRGLPRQPAQPH